MSNKIQKNRIAHHPFFIATQAHPEFTSRFENPNPLFAGFIAAAQQHHQQRKIVAAMSAVQETKDVRAHNAQGN